MNKTDFSALQKWNKMPNDFQKRIINSVFYPSCYLTTVVDYTREFYTVIY